MHTKRQSIFVRIAGIALALALTTPAWAAATNVDFSHAAFAPVLGPTSIPIGHSEFCQLHPAECTANGRVVDAMQLTEDRWAQLVGINNAVNAAVTPVSDQDYYQVAERWAYPDGYGDCEDFALAKRRELIEAGWDPSTLLMTVVREQNGNGHAVLMVRTDRGDLVLDNQDSLVRVWNDTPYQFIKRQSQQNAGQWVDIADDRGIVITAAF